MLKPEFLNPRLYSSGGVQCKGHSSQGEPLQCLPQALDQTQVLNSLEYLVIHTDIIFQHHLILSVENRLVELVSQLLYFLVNLSGVKRDSQASTSIHLAKNIYGQSKSDALFSVSQTRGTNGRWTRDRGFS